MKIRRLGSHLAAYAWVHLLRMRRFALSLINWGLVDFLWLSIYVFSVLAFAEPKAYPLVVPAVFWAMIAFSLMSTPVWTVGNWVRFYIGMGLLEEHELAGANHSAFLALRALPAIPMALIAGVGAATLLYAATGINPLRVRDPILLAVSLAAILIQATLYSLLIAFAGMATRTPTPLLDFMNFFLFVAGGIAVPVSTLPGPLRLVAVLTPYSHPAELMRHAVAGMEPYLGVAGEALASLAYTCILGVVAWGASRWALRKVRVWGAKGIGMT